MSPTPPSGADHEANIQLSDALLRFQQDWRTDRGSRMEDLAPFGGFGELRHRVGTSKRESRAHWDEQISMFQAAAEAAGATVFFAATGDAANQYIVDLCATKRASFVVKGKSMATEETRLNEALEDVGVTALETDLGEWLVQLAGDHPSHLVMPAIHMRRHEVAALLEKVLGRPFDSEDIPSMVHAARTEMRGDFARAAVGITGANVLIAESGSIVIVCNEGNNRMSVALPDTHVVVAGIEKLIGTYREAMDIVRLLPRSATGQTITTYTNFIRGPRPGQEQHIVLLDNGRRAMQQQPEYADALACLRCGACANVCPAFQVVGGHRFGHIYTGPIGLVVTPHHHGIDEVRTAQDLCVSCGACTTVCPAEIPLDRQILSLRRDVRRSGSGGWLRRFVLKAFQSRRLYAMGTWFGSIVGRPFARGDVLRLPISTRWTSWRSVPAVPRVSARQRLANRTRRRRSGPRVGVLLQCVSDRVAPGIAVASVQILEALGYNVEIPKGQHCCGLPAFDSGEWGIAEQMARSTVAEFEQFDVIVTPAPSCVVAMAHEYERLFADDPVMLKKAKAMAPKVHDLVTFVEDRAAALPASRTGPMDPVTVHRFCQSGNVLGHTDEIDRLMAAVGVEVVRQAEPDVCCGFGGSTSITAPDVSQGISERKLASLTSAGVGTVVTDNPGCVLHLRGVLDAAGLEMEVLHPAEVVARRLALLEG